MSDIFDEVDDILSQVSDEPTDSVVSTEDVEKSFNESELQDIMAEIESLEKEFETEEPVMMAEPIVVPIIQTELQTEIDRELEMSLVEKEEEELRAMVEVEKTKVLAFEKPAPPPEPPSTAKSEPIVTPITTARSEISFEATGQMKLNLGFKVGEETARLTIDPELGLVVTLSGVRLSIKEDEGCTVMMDNGVKFTIPLTSAETDLKKKAA